MTLLVQNEELYHTETMEILPWKLYKLYGNYIYAILDSG